MTKLTAPSPKNRERRKKFFEDHPELKNADAELLRIEKSEKKGRMKSIIKNFKNSTLKSKGKKLKTKGAFGKKPDYLVKKIELETV